MPELTAPHLARLYDAFRDTEVTFNAQVIAKLARCELKDDVVLDGSIVRVEEVVGSKDAVALSIQFSSDPPISYKQKLNGYFTAQDTPR